LRDVAAVVNADRFGYPNKAVMHQFGVSQRTASRWIKAASKYIDSRNEEEEEE
jgi:hypothetical protein